MEIHLESGTLRGFLDGELEASEMRAVTEHLPACSECAAELTRLRNQAAFAAAEMGGLPQMPVEGVERSAERVWPGLRRRMMEAEGSERFLAGWKGWSLAGGLATAALALCVTAAPVRVWAQSLLAVFRVEHFTVLELNHDNVRALGNNAMVNQNIGRIFSDEVEVTEAPGKPQPVTDGATASKLAGFSVKLLAGRTTASLMLEGGASARMKLDRDRLQTLLNEADRGDIHLPASIDGATIRMHVPAGVMAQYGNCGGEASNGVRRDDTCVTLMQVPSPTASMPSEIDPAQIAQVALEMLGMNSKDAENFTRTVDWTSTLVLPVFQADSSYEHIQVNGDEGILMRPAKAQSANQYTLMWVDSGIVFLLNGVGDDASALNLAAQLG